MSAFYKSLDIRIKFGSPGKPISYHTLKRYRDEGIGPLPGESIKTPLPCTRVNSRHYIYPKSEIDELLDKLEKMARNRI